MKSITTSAFIEKHLPLMVLGKPHLDALFLTYREVTGYDSGTYAPKPGLSIVVQSGKMPVDVIEPKDASTVHETMQRKLAATSTLATKSSSLAVVYLGLMVMAETLFFIHQLKSERPNGQCVVVACTCQLQEKLQALRAFADTGLVNHIIVTRNCGATGEMRSILESLIDTWP